MLLLVVSLSRLIAAAVQAFPWRKAQRRHAPDGAVAGVRNVLLRVRARNKLELVAAACQSSHTSVNDRLFRLSISQHASRLTAPSPCMHYICMCAPKRAHHRPIPTSLASNLGRQDSRSRKHGIEERSAQGYGNAKVVFGCLYEAGSYEWIQISGCLVA